MKEQEQQELRERFLETSLGCPCHDGEGCECEYRTRIADFWLSIIKEREEKLVERIEELYPEKCNCVGAKYECEHWGRHETIQDIIKLIKE